MITPWGKSQSKEIMCDGIVFYSTASHGGYKVNKALNQEIPEVFRCNDGWYEEDCAWSIVWVFLSSHFAPGVFDPKTFIQANNTIRTWYPHEWQIYNGIPVVKADKCFDGERGTCDLNAYKLRG